MEKHTPATRPLGPDGIWRSAGAILFMILALIAGLGAGGANASGTAAHHGQTVALQSGLRCQPGQIAGFVGQPLVFDIYVEEIIGLWGADVRMSFDPAIVQIVDADPDAVGIQIEILDDFLDGNFVLSRNGDNETGTIHYAVTHLNGPWAHQPATGSGSLARVTLEPLQAGDFTMPFTYYVLNDADGFAIEVAAVDCPVNISEAPDPNTTLRLPIVFTGIKEPPPFRD